MVNISDVPQFFTTTTIDPWVSATELINKFCAVLQERYGLYISLIFLSYMVMITCRAYLKSVDYNEPLIHSAMMINKNDIIYYLESISFYVRDILIVLMVILFMVQEPDHFSRPYVYLGFALLALTIYWNISDRIKNRKKDND